MGGKDKGLLDFRGEPLVAPVIRLAEASCDEIIISANRNLEAYRAFGHPVLPDSLPGVGPLAGVLTGLRLARHPLLLVLPCDTPRLPGQLVNDLAAALEQSGADIAFPSAGGHNHHAIMLCRITACSGLETLIANGERRIGAWHASLNTVAVPFEEADAFTNVNSPAELAHAVG
jgi:molybdopterin-guanine dinucleotide biosynthesis protein A